MELDKKQIEQIEKQKAAHTHKNYAVDIVLTDGAALENFNILEKVLRPEQMCAVFLARWLFFNNGLYVGKNVLDMGSGSGILGLVCGLYGAKKVVLTDISEEAYKNSLLNIKQFGIANKSEVFHGNLFEKTKGKFDMIIFNHPFFHDNNFEEHLKHKSMTVEGTLIHRFLDEAKNFLNKDGIIVMPYYQLAGPTNSPAVQAPKHGYSVQEIFSFNSTTGLQKGDISIYILKL